MTSVLISGNPQRLVPFPKIRGLKACGSGTFLGYGIGRYPASSAPHKKTPIATESCAVAIGRKRAAPLDGFVLLAVQRARRLQYRRDILKPLHTKGLRRL